jgi:ferric-dicitrate binding protein FerR (iron transport regulator)
MPALARKGGAVFFIAIFVVALAAVFNAEAGESGAWVLATVEGTVDIDGKTAGSMGATIDQGSVIETGADGNVVLTRSGDSITMFPNSKMSVPASDNGEDPGVLQTLGKLLFRMESRESRDFKIETPYLAAAIKGTTFTVEVEDNDAAVEVSEGSVLVTANRSGQSAYVGAGERANVRGGGGDAVQVSEIGDAAGDDGSVTKPNPDKLEGGSRGNTKESTTSSTKGETEDSTTGKDSPDDANSGKGNDLK